VENKLRKIWTDRSQYSEGVGKTVIIPSVLDALVDRLELLLASKTAGNTGLRNEIVTICDELLRQKVMSKSLYKKLSRIYKKNVAHK